MNPTATLERKANTERCDAIQPETILQAIEHATHLLPAQGPITSFVHHNTLHAFEDLEFDAAVRKGARLFGCHPYLPETRYREMLTTGRISEQDIEAVLIEQLGDRADELLGFLGTRFSLHRAILNHSLHDGPSMDLRWVIGDTNALNRFRSDATEENRKQLLAETKQWVMRDLRYHSRDGNRVSEAVDPSVGIPNRLSQQFEQLFELFGKSGIEKWSDATWESFVLHLLWKTCQYGARQAKAEITTEPFRRQVRHRDWLQELTGQDTDEMVDSILIPFCAAFLDQGFSHWGMPDREQGFLGAFTALYGNQMGLVDPWRRGLAAELQRLRDRNTSAVDSIVQSFTELGVSDGRLESVVDANLLALRGFAGMLWQLESRGDRASRAMPSGTLVEFLAVRLILDRLALTHLVKTATSFDGELSDLPDWAAVELTRLDSTRPNRQLRSAFGIFELAQLLGWRPRRLSQLRPDEWQRIVSEINQFSGIERRQIYHLAYERKYRNESLDAIRIHCTRTRLLHKRQPPIQPDFQIVCCIDEREESFRRHLEEVHPACETFGAAGFFCIPMYYRGAADAHFTPLCPVVIKPNHYVTEEVVYSLKKREYKRKWARRTIGTVTHRVHIGSRTLTGGWLGTAALGSLATFPLVARILFPRLTAQLRGLMGGFVKPPEVTRLQLERDPQQEPGPDSGQLGFTVEEMAGIVERLLRDIGLTSNFARFVFICGHGSSSLNNPHESAHDCGACAGARGGPNARAFAHMANDPRVRKRVSENGLSIPIETVFVGIYHNTCDDSITYYDLDRIPPTHLAEFETIVEALDAARKRDAHERCRRFESAPLDLNFEDALKHVEGRAEDLSQVRPEYGHATNALCFVGQREWSRGLFLDRRAFLQSYDPNQDSPHVPILERILQAVIPVCAGINLEYYFSFVDPVGYGCGTKLPHNITSLIGVMNGAGSDLRPGLPWQMVEIHEPVRLLFVIEASAEAMFQVISRNAAIERLCNGNWVQLAILDSATSELKLYRNGRFIPQLPGPEDLPSAAGSVDWYRGWRDHLKFASIDAEFNS